MASIYSFIVVPYLFFVAVANLKVSRYLASVKLAFITMLMQMF